MFESQNIPMYLQIKNDILKKIRQGIYLPGSKIPTEQELVAQYSVSRITITNALNELKKEGVLKSYPRRGTFLADQALIHSAPAAKEVSVSPAAPALSGPDYKLKEIAIIIPTMEDRFSIFMINGILNAFPETSYLCHIFRSHTPEFESFLLSHCFENKISGIVLFPQYQSFFSKEIITAIAHDYPMVLVDRCLPKLDTSYVISDNEAAGELCVRHLYQFGHKNIAFASVSNEKNFAVKHRARGIQAAAAALDLPAQAATLLYNLQVEKKADFYRDRIADLIFRRHITSFILCENELIPLFHEILSSLNLSIPEDISLICFDQPFIQNIPTDFFTHINQSEYTIGNEAGKILRQKLETGETANVHLVITPKLEIHESTGPSSLNH